jgi:hypothetical protein
VVVVSFDLLKAIKECGRQALADTAAYRDGMDWRPGTAAIVKAKGLLVDTKVGAWGEHERLAYNTMVKRHRELNMSDGCLVTLLACAQAAAVAIDALPVGLTVKEYDKLVEPFVKSGAIPALADAKATLPEVTPEPEATPTPAAPTFEFEFTL